MHSFGSIWGVAIPAAIFSNRFSIIAETDITDPAVRAIFVNGNDAYQRATADFIRTFSPSDQTQIIGVYSKSLHLVWQISVAFSGLFFLIVLFKKQVKLRKELDTEFGLESVKKDTKGPGSSKMDAIALVDDKKDTFTTSGGEIEAPGNTRKR
jgi:hypothetical protein